MIKSYTDLEQSKKLAKILPLESADMRIGNYVGESGKIDGTNVHYYPKGESFGAPEIIYAWSLSALLDVSPEGTMLLKSTNISSVGDIKYNCECYKISIDKWFDNPIDACVAMIEKLNELKLL